MSGGRKWSRQEEGDGGWGVSEGEGPETSVGMAQCSSSGHHGPESS